MTHTPGPWIAGFNESNVRTKTGNWYFVQSNGSGNHNEIVRLSGVSQENRTALANARLIAAAPDLLEALKYAVDVLPMGSLLSERLKAAIATAEGEA